MSIGILPTVKFTEQKRVAKPVTSVCSRIIKLTNNQKKAGKEPPCPKMKSKRRQKCSGCCEKCTTIGLRLARLEGIGFSKRRTVPGKTRCKDVLGPIRRIRFTQSTLRHASIRDKKGPSLGKIQVKNPHQRSPYAMKFEDRSQEGTERQQRCARSKA